MTIFLSTTLDLMSDISVLGIFVADISFSGPKIPAIGETILEINIILDLEKDAIKL